MNFLKGCYVVYEDFSTKAFEECDGIIGAFNIANVPLVEILGVILIILLIIWVILKIFTLGHKK